MDVLFGSATDAAALLRRGELSARELTEAQLARVDAVNPALNAVVEVRRDAAVSAADAADAALARGEDVGPLHGVPTTVKDCLDVAGMRTTWGVPAFADFVADEDATVVRRLAAAGATVFGKTNAHEMLGDYGQTVNDVYGRTNNPWDVTRTPGGSTGGGAAAVAAGLSFVEYGSDLVGSIRIPASFCGVYGLRPSADTVPLTGLRVPRTPHAPSEWLYLSTIGPLTRSAADLRTVLRATAGPESTAARAYSWRLPEPRHTRLADYRVGVVLDHPSAPVSSEVAAVLSNAVDALGRAGAKVVEGWPDGVDPDRHAETFGFHVGLFFAFQQSGHDFAPVSEVIEQENLRMASRTAWERYFADVDVLLCPTNFTPAFPHDTRPFGERVIATPEGDRPYDAQPFWVAHAALPGLPAVSAPVGRTAGGLPVGAQVIGPRLEDDTAITFAELLADVVGGYERSPA